MKQAYLVLCLPLLLACGCGGSGTMSDSQMNRDFAQASAVTATSNPLVASYTVAPTAASTVHIEFGPDTSYGFSTSSQHTDGSGAPLTFEVAGMKASSTYHMHAVIEPDSGTAPSDSDQTFTTGAIPAGLIPSFTVATTSGLTPQPGIELVNDLPGGTPPVPFASDLSGNVLWYYSAPEASSSTLVYPIKQLASGNYAMLIAPNSQTVLGTPPTASTPNYFRIVDLVGNTVKQVSITDLNASLAASGNSLVLQAFTHDFAALPNGHFLVMANTIRSISNLVGYPSPLAVLGDVVVDLDVNLKPVWLWNEFDHLDVSRHPMGLPDWTHSNAIAYSPDDGNFLVSIRHQNWVVKVDYKDGAGSGAIDWKLGEGGDFKLEGATDPTDWFYAQHDVNFVSSNTTGSFKLAVMDNGNDRIFVANATCGAAGNPPCQYSTVPVMQVDENAKTVSYLFHDILLSQYSPICGNTRVLGNTNIEYDLGSIGGGSVVTEVTPTATPQTVWQMNLVGNGSYRIIRIPSLYPGVQW